jgi:hypothetical protein
MPCVDHSADHNFFQFLPLCIRQKKISVNPYMAMVIGPWFENYPNGADLRFASNFKVGSLPRF